MKCATCGHPEAEHYLDPDDGPMCEHQTGPTLPFSLGGTIHMTCGRCDFVPALRVVKADA